MADLSSEHVANHLPLAPSSNADLYSSNSYPSVAQRLNFDVLTRILITAWSTHGISPIVLGSPCRLWRTAALGTPRIWSKIPSVISPDDEMIQAFLNRSQPLPLHIGISPRMTSIQHQALRADTHRIHSLTLTCANSILRETFPVLERLHLAISYDLQSKSAPFRNETLLDAVRYPKLRELHIFALMTPLLQNISPTQGFPPLQVLSIDYNGSPYSLAIINNCSTTLVSLSITIRYVEDETIRFVLPRLRRLSITDSLPHHAVRLQLNVEELESIHHEISWNNISCPAAGPFTTLEISDSQRLTDLHISSIRLDITCYPQLRRLTIAAELIELHSLQTALIEGLKFCPQLESICYSCRSGASEVKHEILGAIDVCGRSQSIILRETEYRPVIIGNHSKLCECFDNAPSTTELNTVDLSETQSLHNSI